MFNQMTPNPQPSNGSKLNGSNGAHLNGSNGLNGTNGQVFANTKQANPDYQNFEDAFVNDTAVDIVERGRFQIHGETQEKIRRELDVIRGEVKSKVSDQFLEFKSNTSYADIFDNVSINSKKLDQITDKILDEVAKLEAVKSTQIKFQVEADAYASGPKDKEDFVKNIRPGRQNERRKSPGKIMRFLTGVKNKIVKPDSSTPIEKANNLSRKDEEAGLIYGSRIEAAEKIAQLSNEIAQTKAKLAASKIDRKERLAALKEIEGYVRKTADVLGEFRKMIRIQQADASLGNSTKKLFWKDQDYSYYKKGFGLQANVEEMMIDLAKQAQETQAAHGVNIQPINDAVTIDPDVEDVSLQAFTIRQQQLEIRLAGLKEQIDQTNEEVAKTNSVLEKDLKAKAESKNWIAKSVKERSEVFWARFGDDITLIREWQAMLPTVARGGNVNRLVHITAIDNKYRNLRGRVMKFQDEFKVSGMIVMLDRELGTYKINKFVNNPRRQEVMEELDKVQRALRIATRPVLEKQLERFVYHGMTTPVVSNIDNALRVAHNANNAVNQVISQGTQNLADIQRDLASQPAPLAPAPNAPTQPTLNLNPDPNQPSVTAAVSGASIPAAPATIDTTPANVQPSVVASTALNIDYDPDQFIGFDFGNKFDQGFVYNPNLAKSNIIDQTTGLIKVVLKNDALGNVSQTKIDTTPAAVQPSVIVKPAKEAKEDAEKLRQTESLYIGDLNGNMEMFAKSLVSLKLSKNPAKPDFSDLNWIGGNRKLILIGDILADRVPEGLSILSAVDRLNKEAAEEGGRIVTMYGNHEDFAVSFLLGKNNAGNKSPISDLSRFGTLINSLQNDFQGLGIVEFIKRFSAKGKEIKGTLEEFAKSLRAPSVDAFTLANDLGVEILENMRKDEEGKKILNGIAQMKLVHLDGDTLVLHTEPTLAILTEILDGVKNKKEFQKALAGINKEFKDLTTKLFAGVADAGEHSLALEK
ncbi:hypothetical protein IT411_03580, partial [Candidatus Peregrinibacteria bacterium]|nr:hypothetical protein [Candidatus Peregrinibacteria bacterium]